MKIFNVILEIHTKPRCGGEWPEYLTTNPIGQIEAESEEEARKGIEEYKQLLHFPESVKYTIKLEETDKWGI